MSSGSKIFSGHRALGFVSNHVPLAIHHHQKHKENYVVTCVGKSFQSYNCSRFGLVGVSDSHPGEISVLAVDRHCVFTACRNVIRAFTRGKKVIHTYEGHSSDVHLLLPFGAHLISVDIDSNVIVWDIEYEGQYTSMMFNNSSFQVTVLMHPSTYLNKVLFGSKQGSLQLWNIKQNKLVHTFNGWTEAVNVVEQAPAVDVVAIGLTSGQILLHNLRFDETITTFNQFWGPVTSISFRTDGHPIMATGSAVGHIGLWDLEERKLKSQIRNAHTTAVTGMKCLPNEPLMVTSAADNALKMWIFDMPDGGGRLLRERSGHSAPPHRLRYYGTNGEHILSAGDDSTLRSFSTVHDRHNKSLGRASYNKAQTKKNTLKYDEHKMPYITEFAAEPSRQSDWDNIVACHRGIAMVTTWSFQRSTMGEHKIEPLMAIGETAKWQCVVAQCVDITSCGHFVVIGYSCGRVDLYNLQSGIYRGSYGEPAHNGHVQGVAVDGVNQVTVTVGRNGSVKFWQFKHKHILDNMKLNSCTDRILLHRESSMLAIARDDFQISIIDIDTRRVVRNYIGHSNRITDMTYSSDSRWLITSSMDCSVRVWDMPTGRLIDCFLVDSPVTSLTMSPTSDFLATSHLDDVGVYLWSNFTLFSYVPLRPVPSDFVPQLVDMPTTKRASGSKEELREEEEFINAEFKSMEQISEELITLSLLPSSRWHNLLNLEVIKHRNKPKDPPKVPKAAPFFLSTISGLEPKFVAEVTLKENDKEKSKFLEGSLLPLSTLGHLLEQSEKQNSYEPVIEYLKTLGPSSIDLEIRSLAPEGGGSVSVMAIFLKFINAILLSGKNFEVSQAYLGLFLKLHTDLISSNSELMGELEELADVQNTTWKTIQDLFYQTLCLVNYLKAATL